MNKEKKEGTLHNVAIDQRPHEILQQISAETGVTIRFLINKALADFFEKYASEKK